MILFFQHIFPKIVKLVYDVIPIAYQDKVPDNLSGKMP